MLVHNITNSNEHMFGVTGLTRWQPTSRYNLVSCGGIDAYVRAVGLWRVLLQIKLCFSYKLTRVRYKLNIVKFTRHNVGTFLKLMCEFVVASACCCPGYSTRINTTQIQGKGEAFNMMVVFNCVLFWL